MCKREAAGQGHKLPQLTAFYRFLPFFTAVQMAALIILCRIFVGVWQGFIGNSPVNTGFCSKKPHQNPNKTPMKPWQTTDSNGALV
ncbi:MAG: hypothetical protein CFE23_15450 [Flavobacterium sp. BFFFF1]|nr:MAG: hypothetical protein CFE23_15450 [Flavobacterium sp. BFFFF1]